MASRERQPADHQRPATPIWVSRQQAKVDKLSEARAADPEATTHLIIPAAQHPLVNGERPGLEFSIRLQYALYCYRAMTDAGKAVELFLPGSRHQSKREGPDRLALYDAAALWLMRREEDIDPDILHGKDWIDKYRPDRGVYSEAEEIEVAAAAFRENPRFESASYICSPGQRARARIHALAYGLPLHVEVAPGVASGSIESDHGGLKGFAMRALTRVFDPYGDGITNILTRGRIPEDGNMDSLKEAYNDRRFAALQELTW